MTTGSIRLVAYLVLLLALGTGVWFDRQLTPAFLFEHDPTGHARGHAFGRIDPRIKSEGQAFSGSCSRGLSGRGAVAHVSPITAGRANPRQGGFVSTARRTHEMSIPHTRQTPPPRLSVQVALLWIALIFLVMALAVAFGDHTPPPV